MRQENILFNFRLAGRSREKLLQRVFHIRSGLKGLYVQGIARIKGQKAYADLNMFL